MRSTAHSVLMLDSALRRERRCNRRLRLLLEALEEGMRLHQRELDIQRVRIAQLQAQLDVMKSSPR